MVAFCLCLAMESPCCQALGCFLGYLCGCRYSLGGHIARGKPRVLLLCHLPSRICSFLHIFLRSLLRYASLCAPGPGASGGYFLSQFLSHGPKPSQQAVWCRSFLHQENMPGLPSELSPRAQHLPGVTGSFLWLPQGALSQVCQPPSPDRCVCWSRSLLPCSRRVPGHPG